MSVELLVTRDLAGGRYKSGQVITCSENFARQLIQSGDAELYEEKDEEKNPKSPPLPPPVSAQGEKKVVVPGGGRRQGEV